VGFAGAGITQQHDGFPGVDPTAAGDGRQLHRGNARNGVKVELREASEPWEFRFGDPPGPATITTFIDFERKDSGLETQMGLPFPDGDLSNRLASSRAVGR
jgi:hypothetical protein